jgi:TolB-like protein
MSDVAGDAALPKPTVFLSYASEDREAARRIGDALLGNGLEVWLDESELGGGDVWDQKIRKQIRECDYFMALVSAHTEARHEGYFRREWRLAVERTLDMADDHTFLLPVVIDGTLEAHARVPGKFLDVQWLKLPGGQPTPALETLCRRLVSGNSAASSAAKKSSRRPSKGAPSPVPPPREFPREEPGQKVKFWFEVAGWAFWSVWALYKRLPRWIRFLLICWLAVLLLNRGCSQSGHHEYSEDAKSSAAARKAALAIPALKQAEGLSDTVRQATESALNAAPEKSIAVLPFVDMSEKKDQEYFSDGLSEELLDLLAQVPDLRVPARTSSFYFKGKQATVAEIAKALGVAHVLEGSVRKDHGKVRVTVQLIRTDNGYHMWSKTYDRDLKDLFEVQDEIANAVVAALKIQLLPTQHLVSAYTTTSPEAHDAYLLGWQLHFLGDADADRRAIAAFHKALAADPAYAPAYVGLGMATISSASDLGGMEAPLFQESMSYVDRAIELAPKLSIAYSARGIFRLEHLDWRGAQADIAQAVTLDPRDSQAQRYLSRYLASQGLLTEAVAASRRAIEIDPLDVYALQNLAKFLTASADYAGAREALRRAREINPGSWELIYDSGLIDLLNGNTTDALAASQQISLEGYRWTLEAMARHSLGQTEQAGRLTADLIKKRGLSQPYAVALVFAWRGETDRAFEWLNRAYLAHDDRMEVIKYDPLLAPLRPDPRYGALLRTMNL